MEKRLATIILESVYRNHYIDRKDLCDIVCSLNKIIKEDCELDLEWSGNGFSSLGDKFQDQDRVWNVKEFRATNSNTGETIVIYTDVESNFFLTKIDNVIGKTLGFCVASKAAFGSISSDIERRRSIMAFLEKGLKSGQKALDRKLNIDQSFACVDHYYEDFQNESETE